MLRTTLLLRSQLQTRRAPKDPSRSYSSGVRSWILLREVIPRKCPRPLKAMGLKPHPVMSSAVSVLILLLFIGVAYAQRQGADLPNALNEDEVQQILREHKPKSHVEATFKVSDARLTTALNLARDNQYRESAQNLDLYVGLVTYADSYARRNTCLLYTSDAADERSSV